MSPLRVLLLVLGPLIGVVAIAIPTYDWYYTKYVWPETIQREVLGVVLSASGELINHEGFSHYGQGMYRWRFRISKNSQLLNRFCIGQELAHCKFSRSREVSPDLARIVSYEEGILSVEEDWT